MEIKIQKAINRATEKELAVFYRKCLEKDPLTVTPLSSTKELAGVVTFLYYDDDNQLSAFLSAYETDDESIEISAFTLPEKRHQGYFKKLYEEVKKYYPEEKRKDISFQIDENSPDTIACVKHLQCVYEDTEYLLVCKNPKDRIVVDKEHPDRRILEMRSEGCGDLNVLSAVHSHVFEQTQEESLEFLNDIKVIPGIQYMLLLYHEAPAGCFFFQVTKQRTYMFGFGIIPEIQGIGMSDIAMRCVFRALPSFCTEMTVQVSASNERAFKLYKKSGFEVSEALTIYHMPESYK